MKKSRFKDQNSIQTLKGNLIRFAELMFSRMSDKYGGGTTLNELVMLNYGFVCYANGKDICVTQASNDLNINISTVSRILTNMRAKGFVKEFAHPTDRRRRIFNLADSYLESGDSDISTLLSWCADPENSLV